MRSGFVSIIGRPNVGKSTLLNALVSEHIAIVSNKPGTTRNVIQGIYNDDEHQIVFVDTPGLHKPINKLGKVLNKQASSLTRNVDLILFVVDASEHLGKGDLFIMENLRKSEVPIVLILNKVDLISKEKVLEKIVEYKDLLDFCEIVPLSAAKNDNLDRLMNVIRNFMVDECRYFDVGQKTSSSKLFMISEFVREKLLWVTEEEIPHRITCVTTHFEEKEKIANAVVEIIVDRDSLKRIIIGHKGERLKEVGTRARKDIEKLLGKKVYLELFVKTIKDWRNKDNKLLELGFKDSE